MKLDRDVLNGLFRYCLALTGEREQALDLMHTAIEAYLRRQPQELQYPIAYIRRIARNRYYDELRRSARSRFELHTPMEADAHYADERDLESFMVEEMTVRQLWRVMSPQEREVVFLWAVEGRSAAEIAMQLGEPRSTILSRLHRLRLRLRDQFSELINGDHHG